MNRAIRHFVPDGTLPGGAMAAAIVVGAAFVWGLVAHHEARAVAALASSWLFFTGAATGAIAMSAILELAGARWSRPLHDVTVRLARYLPVAAGVLVILAAFAPAAEGLHGGAAVGFFGREVVAALALFVAARMTLRGEPGARSAARLIAYCVLFALVGSLWAFDFVVSPNPGFGNTLAGPHLFVGAVVSGVGFAVVGALRAGTLDVHQRRDAATLVIALAVFWAYLFWSQLLTLWYGNLPDELAFLAPRGAGAWSVVTLLVVAGTLAVPFGLLLNGRAKTSTGVLCTAVIAQLVGLWLERQLLVVPSLAGPAAAPLDPAGAVIQLGMAALFVLCTWPWAERRTAPASGG